MAQQLGAGTLSYSVLGWYSDPASDVLAGWVPGDDCGGWARQLEALDWSASGAVADGTHASVYHGAVYGVSWVPNAPAPPPSPKDGARPAIAMGNTSVDAVVAFAQAAFGTPGNPAPAGMTPRQAALLLEAFQYNLLSALDEPGGESQVEQAIHAQWFGAAPAGTSWSIVDAPAVPGAPPAAPPPVAELAAEAAWLAALNTAQATFDATVRTLMGTQRRLFELWWKQQAAPVILGQTGSWPWRVTPDQLSAALDPSDPAGPVAQARTALASLSALAAQMPTATGGGSLDDAIAAFALAKGLPTATRVLKPVARPRFWSPADPVVVLSGAAHMLQDEPGTTLACRWPVEVVTSLNASAGDGGPTLAPAAAALAASQPAVPWTGLPAVGPALFAESFLLDPANAALDASVAGQSLSAGQLAALAASIAAPRAGAGVVPAVLPPWPWVQPWQPLYLDWQLTWYPIPFVGADGQPNWAFDGTDYDLARAVTTPEATSLSGRSVLTPKPSFEFKARIDQFVHDNPGSPAATALQGIEGMPALGSWDFLSQTLSGLSTQLVSWSPVPTLLPSSTPLPGGTESMAELVGEQGRHPPNPQLAAMQRKLLPSSFEGMRGGQLAFARLSIVDVFGQTLEVVTQQTALQTSVTRADGVQVTQPVVAVDTAGLVQLPPRVVQPARLNFDFATGTAGNPIVGWILPDHVSQSLAAYGADGTLYGELGTAVDAQGKPYAAWWQAPDGPYATLPALAAANAQLGGMLQAIQFAGAAALSDVLQAIDETLWTVDPLGDRTDTFLSVLLGRPLAVVAATLSLELQAEAWRDPAWPYTFASPLPDPAFLSYRFPVQLGDLASRRDGLLGYYVDGGFGALNVVHTPVPGPGDPAPSGYLSQIGAGNWVNLGFAATGAGTARSLTLLMDPRASVRAQSGILPSKEVTLVPAWVDDALAAMRAAFRTGPMLAESRMVTPQGGGDAVQTLMVPLPAEQHGTWTWRQPAGGGAWPSTALAAADAGTVFLQAPPILRDGVLQLTHGLDT
jgi:hypothetical protein